MDKFFPQHIAEDFIERLDRLSGNSAPCWGKMTAAQMLAHCCEVTREALGEKKITMVDLDNETRKKLLYINTKDNTPMEKFIEADEGSVISDYRDFETEKSNFITTIKKLRTGNKIEFENRLHPFFGNMTANEWFVLTLKHLDHHFRQFGL